MKNYYQTLGVDRTATADEIKRAYRKLASQHHPDKGGDKHKFQEIEEAYRTLGDNGKRAQYDNPSSSPFRGGFGGGMPPGFDFDSIFDIFGARFHQSHRTQQARMSLWITLLDVAQGGHRTISVGTQQGTITVEIEIPPGINDGDTVQYPGVAPLGMDLIITFRIHPNPKWSRNGLNIATDETITVWDCILGCELNLTDILGYQITLTIPPRTNPGTTLRLRGRGLKDRHGQVGDLLVKIQANIPDDIDPNLLTQIEQTRTK